jgi:hypothetical protein
MRRRSFVTLMVLSAFVALTPSEAHARKRSLAQHAKADAKHKAFLKAATRKARATRNKLRHSPAVKGSARKLQKSLSKKQRAALRALGNMMVRDARLAAKRRKKTFPVSAKRLRPYVVTIGSKNATALAAASMMLAASQVERDVTAIARRWSKNLERKSELRKEISRLREKGGAEERLHKLESELESMEDMSQQLQMQLQDAMNKQQQAMQILSNIMKNQHDTLKAIIQNMR